MTRTYIHLSRAWYGPANLQHRDFFDDITIMVDDLAEFHIAWRYVGAHAASPRLEVFDEAMPALAKCSDLIDAMAEHDGEDMSPADFCAMLDGLGFVDVTPTERGK